MEGAHGVGDAASALDDEFEGALGVDVPLPGVFKGVNLRTGLGAVFFGEEDVVVLPRVEGRVEIDEVDGLVLDVALEDFVVVAVVDWFLGFTCVGLVSLIWWVSWRNCGCLFGRRAGLDTPRFPSAAEAVCRKIPDGTAESRAPSRQPQVLRLRFRMTFSLGDCFGWEIVIPLKPTDGLNGLPRPI